MTVTARFSLRLAAAFGLSIVLGQGCSKTDDADGGGKARRTPQAPADEPTIVDETQTRRQNAQALEPSQYWKAVALQRVVEQQAEGDTVWLELSDGAEKKAAKVEAGVLEDAQARDRGYRDAVDDLVTQLHTLDAAGQAEVIEHLERLTKTERGGPNAWMDWHDEAGDYLVYNAELDRLDVDTKRQLTMRPDAVDGLRLWAKLDRDRYKARDRIELRVRLENALGGSGYNDNALWVNKRMAVGAELQIDVRHHGHKDITAVPLVEAEPKPPLTREDFTQTRSEVSLPIERRIDLSKLLEDPALAPGRYSVDVRYVNAERGESLGLEPNERSKELAGGGPAWTGELESVTLFFEIVPW